MHSNDIYEKLNLLVSKPNHPLAGRVFFCFECVLYHGRYEKAQFRFSDIVRLIRVHRARDYNRFNRWLRRGFRLKLLDGLIDARAVTRSPAIDSSYIKAQRCAFGGKRGRSDQAVGRSRGGWSTKIHALTDVIARPFALMPKPGNISDVSAAPALLEKTEECAICPATKVMTLTNCGARYDKLAANFLSGVALATAIASWL